MSNALKDHLLEHETSSSNFTHTSLSPYTRVGKYTLTSNDQFYKIYTEQVIEKKKPCYLSEKHMEKYGKPCIDIDLRYDYEESPERKYTVEDIKNLVKDYQCLFNEITDLTLSEEEICAYVLEKDHPESDAKKKITKDGIHIMFPYLSISYEAQAKVRQQLIKKYQDPELPSFFKQCTNPIDKIVDESVIERNNWIMYGSRKELKAQAYKLTYILDGDLDECELPEENYSLVKLLSIQNRLSEHPTKKIAKVEKVAKAEKAKELIDFQVSSSSSTAESSKSKEYLVQLLQLLNPSRVTYYEDWFIIGAILYNNSEDNLDLWKSWSESSDKYNESHCDKLWTQTYANYSSQKKVTIGTLQLMARQDNPEKYFEIMRIYEKEDDLFSLMKKAMRNTHTEFADLTHYVLKHKYVFSKDNWYVFDRSIWRQLESNIPFMKDLSKEVRSIFVNYEIMLNKEILRKGDVDDNDKLMDEKTRLSSTIKLLKNHSYKTAIVNECKELFYDENFYKDLDMNIYLLGFNNGVFDLKNKIFRETKPEDMVSYTTGYDYSTKIISSIRREIEDLFEKSLPDPDVRNFMWMFLGSTLIGRNKNELFVNLEGSGGNGKGVITTLHDNALGDYSGTLDNAYLTNVSSSQEGHNSKMISIFKKRYVQVNEPPKGKYLNQDFIKEITGNDKLQIRKAHAPDPEVSDVPMFKLVMLCNKMPKIDDAQDGGFLRRYKGINFPNRFVDGEPKRANEFRADPNLKTKLKDSIEYRQQYMIILLEKCAKYSENDEKIIIPDVVNAHSRYLVQQYDIYSEFVEIALLITGEKTDIITTKEMFDNFKEFFRDYQSGSGRMPITTQSEFLERMKKCFAITSVEFKNNTYGLDNKRLGKGFVGVKLREIESDEE